MAGIIECLGDIGQIANPCLSTCVALSKKDYPGIGWLAVAVVINQVATEVLKYICDRRSFTGSFHLMACHSQVSFKLEVEK